MGETITVTGMILSAMPIGDYDKRLVLLTKERGKITVFAKGARRQNSPMLAMSNPFVFGRFEVYEGRSSYQMGQANITNYFSDLAKEQPGVYYGFYFLELADYYSREYTDERQMLNLLYLTLKALLSPQLEDELIRYVYELKTLVINGEYPQVFECAKCGEKENLFWFSTSQGGMLCETCRQQFVDAQKIEEATRYTLQYITTSPLEKLYTFAVTPRVLRQLRILMKTYTNCYIDKKFKSLEILEVMVES